MVVYYERVNLIYLNLGVNGNMILIPLEQVPNQQLEIILNNQDCKLHLYVRGDYLYFDLEIASEPFFYGAICYDRTKIFEIYQAK